MTLKIGERRMTFQTIKNKEKPYMRHNLPIVTSVVPINQITIGNSRLLGNFVTIGIGRF